VDYLREYLGHPIPDFEVSFVAIHFYAALFSMDEKNIRKRMLCAGIVCVSGIGSSYMVASQIKKRFKDELEVCICPWNDRASWEKTDFLISTIPLDMEKNSTGNVEKPIVEINTIVSDDDYKNIRKVINTYAFIEKSAAPMKNSFSLDNRIDNTINLLQDVNKLLGSFEQIFCKPDVSFEELITFAAEHFGRDAAGEADIKNDLMEREAAVTQVIYQMRIVLLHVRTSGVDRPIFALITPSYDPAASSQTAESFGGVFLHPHFRQAQACCLMLLPRLCAPEMTRIMGNISSALVDTPVFLDAIRGGNAALTRTILEAELSDALAQFCNEKLKT
jgi:galactitol-specific phosphotransferase system IIB component